MLYVCAPYVMCAYYEIAFAYKQNKHMQSYISGCLRVVYKVLVECITAADGVLSCVSTPLESRPLLTVLMALFITNK